MISRILQTSSLKSFRQRVKVLNLPTTASIISNTAITVGLVGVGDLLAQVYLHKETLTRSDFGAFVAKYDVKRTFDMAMSGYLGFAK